MSPTQREALTKAEATFRRYGDLHAAKPDPAKAAANYEMADRMAAALAEVVEPDRRDQWWFKELESFWGSADHAVTLDTRRAAKVACDHAASAQGPDYKQAFDVWQDKTEWVQKTAEWHELGMHRADVLRQRIEAQRPDEKWWKLYEELRSLIDGGSESMTHEDAVEQVKVWAKAAQQPAPVQEQQPAPASKPVLLQCLGCERVGTQEQLSASTDCDCWLHTQPAPVQEQQFTADELDLMRQWFESMQDTNRSFVIDADKKLHQKIIAAIQAAPRAEQPRKAVKLTREDHDAIRIKAEQRMSDPNLGWGTALIVETEVAVWAKLGVTE